MTISILFTFLCAYKNILPWTASDAPSYEAVEGCDTLQSVPFTHETAASLGRFLLQK